jgi:hypothetical protein
MEGNQMTKLFFILLTITSVINAYGQAPDTLWSRLYGGTNCIPYCTDEGANGIVPMQNGDFVLCGSSQEKVDSWGPNDVWVWKIDSIGRVLWSHSYGGKYDDIANSINKTKDGGFIVCGITYSYGAGSGDFWVLRLNSTGDTLWTKTFGDFHCNSANSVIQTTGGGFLVGGITLFSDNETHEDAVLLKIDSSGKTLWTKVWNNAGSITTVSQTPEGGYILVTGQSVVRTDSLANTLWSKPLQCYNVTCSSDETFIIVGSTRITKLNYNGSILWDGVLDSILIQNCPSILETYDHGYLIYAEMNTVTPKLIRTNSSGVVQWKWNIPNQSSQFKAVCTTNDSGYLAVGQTSSFNARNRDAWAVRFGKDTCSEAVSVNHNENNIKKCKLDWAIKQSNQYIQLTIRNENAVLHNTRPVLINLAGKKVGSFICNANNEYVLNRTQVAHGLHYCVINNASGQKISLPLYVE